MAIRPQGRRAPGWNSICWVHPVRRWVIYANGSTSALPEDAVFNAQDGEWQWMEAGVVPVTPENPTGATLWRGQAFDPGRAGGHLYAVPFNAGGGRFLVALINDATGQNAFGNQTVMLQPGWAWVQLGAGAIEPATGRKLRRAHWMLTGTPRTGTTPELWPFSLNRAYPEWPPLPRRRR